MRQSEKNIKAYKEMLPHMKERVIAAVSLLAVAVTMMASVTYAWFALSKSPEVKGLQTTIAANGNLEIALATGEVITVPADSKVGDGALELVQKNVTWGNLVNLGDPAYGLEHIVLRPAALNKNNLLESPLYAASYGKDGRVEMLDSDFAYAYWDQDTFTADPAKFKYGVRAISSVTYGQAPGQNLALADAVKKAEQSTKQAQMSMQELARHDALQDLVGLMGAYVQAQIDEKMGGSEPFISVSPDQIESMCYLLNELKTSIELSATALADIYNMEMLRRSDQAFVASNKFTGEYLLTETQANIQSKLNTKNSANELVVQPSMLSYLWQLRTDYNTVVADLAVLETYRGRDDVKYRNLNDSTYPTVETQVNHIADVGTATINGTAIGKLSMSNISSLTGSGTKPIVIHKGIIQRMDKFTGAQLESNQLTVSVKVLGMTNNATGKATTSATSPYVLPSEQENALSGDTSYKGSNPIAADTFGLALDFWVRTNAVDTQLTLAGEPVYESVEQPVVVKIGNKDYSLYTVTATVEGEKVSVTAYLNESDNTFYAYDLENSAAGNALGKEADFDSVAPLMETVTTIIGYHGVNRVWDEENNVFIDESSTTMGAGSCYVFYPQSPEDQAKSLQLLQHLKFAFIDQYGTLLGQAVMDTANAYEQPGKVTVPIVCDVTNSSTTDIDGNPVYYITDLEPNTPTLVTALLYLDGMNLTNDQVLAAGDIQGNINLQFSTTSDLNAMSDPVLQQEKCKVTATMEGDTSASIDAPVAQRTKTVTVRVEGGYEPKSVVGYFLREINSTQGIRQGKMTFTPDGNGNWVASYPFTASGKYILREVQLDGVTYNLDQESPLEFTVEGFTISDIYCEHNGKTFMTADRKFDTKVSLTFSTNDVTKMPTSVKGAFIHKDTKNRTTVNFTRDTGSTWVGDATFTTSGEYEMTYLELDGEYTGLPVDDYININLYLGLTASVYTGDTNFGLEDGETRDIPMTLAIRTDGGEPIGNLSNVWLQYADNNSSVPEDGVGAGMVWNSTRKLYEGTFHLTKSGIFDYQYVSVKMGDDLNYLTYADTAPTITAIPTSTPTYLSKEGFGNSFSLGSDAAFVIRMKNAGSATMDAKLTDANGNVYYVRGDSTTEGGEQYFTFTIPVVNGKQSGTWTLEGLYLTNVYGGANNTLINAPTANGPDTATDDKPMYTVTDGYYSRWWAWDVDEVTDDGEGVPTITVGSQIDITFPTSSANANKEFGKSGDGTVTGAFGANYALNSLELQVLAGGKPLSEYGMTLTSAKLTYKYDQTGSFTKVNNTVSKNNYGNYNINTADIGSLIAGDRGIIEYTLGNETDGVYELITTNTGLSVAGSYKADPNSMVLTITTAKGETVEMTVSQSVVATAPSYKVYSVKPTATITGVSGSPSKQEKITYTFANNCESNAPDFAVATDNNSATAGVDTANNKAVLYGDATADNSTQHNGSFAQPTLTVTIAGISSDSTASFILPANGNATAVTFSRTGNGTISNKIGTTAQIKSWTTSLILTHKLNAYYGHGTQSIDQLTVTKDGITFTFTLDQPMTIVNPSSVNQS